MDWVKCNRCKQEYDLELETCKCVENNNIDLTELSEEESAKKRKLIHYQRMLKNTYHTVTPLLVNCINCEQEMKVNSNGLCILCTDENIIKRLELCEAEATERVSIGDKYQREDMFKLRLTV